MKKLVLILMLSMSFTMAGCSSEPADYTESDKDISVDDAKTPVSQTEDDTSKESKSEEVVNTENQEYNIEKIVVLEKDGIKVTAKSIKYGEIFGPELKLLIENNADKDVIIQAEYCSINDIMVNPIFSCTVAAGKKCNDSIHFLSSDIESFGIKAIKDMELKLKVLNAKSFTKVYTSDKIVLKTDAPESFEQEYYDNGSLAFDKKDVKVVIKKIDKESSFLGSELLVYIENNTDKDLKIQSRNVSINGFMVNPIFSCNIVSGKKAYDTITFLDSSLKENEIENIETIELIFKVLDNKYKSYLETKPILINFNK